MFSEYLELDLSTVVPSIAGPKRPQDRIELTDAKQSFRKALHDYVGLHADTPQTALDEAVERLARWRSAAQRFGFDTTEVVAKLRTALGNDLDTVKALKVIDQWAQNTSLGGAQVAAAVDALLGIRLV